jgi:hypothetical protein
MMMIRCILQFILVLLLLDRKLRNSVKIFAFNVQIFQNNGEKRIVYFGFSLTFSKYLLFSFYIMCLQIISPKQ